MIKLTKKIEYSLIALKHMGLINRGQISTAKEIAVLYQIPRELLAKILQQLTRDGYISSVQGPKGGYELSRSPEDVSIVELFKTIEGEAGFTDCVSNNREDCVRMDDCTIRTPMLQISNQINNFFSKITLEDIFKNKISINYIE